MMARLLEGAPSETQAEAAAANPALAAVLGGMNVQHAIVTGGAAMPTNSQGVPWNGGYIVASGNLLADFRVNAAAEGQSKVQAARVYNMTDDPGVRQMLKFNLARDSMHQNQWLAAIEELKDEGLEYDPVPAGIIDEEYDQYSGQLWNLSAGSDSSQGRWASGPRPDGRGEFSYLDSPEPLAPEPTPPSADPYLYATVPGGPNGQRPPGAAAGSQ